jgi:hypothetical protein
MTIEDVFNGAKTALVLYNAYLKTVADEIGMVRALSLHADMCDTMGANQGQMLKEQSGMDEFDAKSAWSLVKIAPSSLGISLEVLEETPQSVLVKCGRCSVFEAGRMMGFNEDTIETFCRSGPNRFLDAATKQLNPLLGHKLVKFRSEPDDFCEEAIVFEG